MNTHTSRTAQFDQKDPKQSCLPGPNGQKATPPAYELDFTDSQNKAVQRTTGAEKQRTDPPAVNNTGLPDGLKAGVESLSGYSMDDVKVHYHSSKPAQINALAYAQGTNIYLGPGQERHLPHEAWHVAQQKQGRVRPTMQVQKGAINDDPVLEKEADVMGGKALLLNLAGSANKRRLPIGTESDIAQRKVGFEFEEQNWRAWIRSTVGKPRPAKRKEVLHRGTGFELQADDSLGADQPTIEFVTSPFEPDMQGMADLTVAMGEIKDIMARIGPLKNKDDKAGEYVQSVEHGLSNSQALLSQGHSRGLFKMQATQGISLEDLPTLFKYMGDQVPGETRAEATDRSGARELMRGVLAPGDIAKVIGNAPALAATAINRLVGTGIGLTDADRRVFAANTDRLLGFLSQLMIYVKMLAAPNDMWVKYMLPMLARTDLATMFKLLPDDQRTALAHNQAAAFIDAVVHAANSNALINQAGRQYDTGYASNAPLLRNYQPQQEKTPIMQSLTISAWLQGLAGDPPIDYLEEKNILPFLNRSKLFGPKKSEYLESLASMQGQVDAPDRPGTSPLVIVENRSIAPSGGRYHGVMGSTMGPDDMEKAAKNYLLFFINMVNRAGAPGPFPNK